MANMRLLLGLRALPAKCSVFLILLTLSAPTLLAQALADKIPSDALIYVSWAGTDNLGPAYAKSHLKGILDESALPQAAAEFLPRLAERAGRMDPMAGDVIKTVSAIGGPMWRKPWAFYFGGIDVGGNGPMPRVAFLFDAGQDANALLQTINNPLRAAGAPLQASMGAPGIVVIGAGQMKGDAVLPPQAMIDLLDGGANADKSKSLAGLPGFTAALSKTKPNSALTVYANTEGIVKLVDDLLPQFGPPGVPAIWNTNKNNLVLNGFKRIVLTSGFDGADWQTDLFVDAPAPRAGLAQMLFDGPKYSDDTLKAVPADATWVVGQQLELNVILDMVGTIGSQAITPTFPLQMNRAFEQARVATGVRLREDLLASMSQDWVLYTSPTVGGGGSLGVVAVNRLLDAEKVDNGLSKLATYFNQNLPPEFNGIAEPKIEFRTTKISGFDIHYFAIPAVAPSWTVKDGYLIVGLFPQTVASAASHVAAKGKSILDNQGFQAIRKRIGGKPGLSLAYFDLPASLPAAYPTMLIGGRLQGFADMFGVPMPEPLVPPLEKLKPHVTPAGMMAWSEADGYHVRSVTPFPGASIVATEHSMFISVIPAGAVAGFGWQARAVPVPQVAQAQQGGARMQAARTDVATLEAGLDRFEVDTGRYPTTEEGLNALLVAPADLAGSWHGPYVNRIPLDPWGRPFIYVRPSKRPGQQFDVRSLGPDGVESPDDIGN